MASFLIEKTQQIMGQVPSDTAPVSTGSACLLVAVLSEQACLEAIASFLSVPSLLSLGATARGPLTLCRPQIQQLSLTMHSTDVEASRATLASLLKANPQVKTIKYRGRTEVLAGALDVAGALPSVESLILSGNGLFAESMQLLLAALQTGCLQGLTTLDLRDNLLGETGVGEVATALLPGQPLVGLTSLHLDSTHASGGGARLLGEALQSPGAAPRLRHLTLSHNDIDEDNFIQGLVPAFRLPHCAGLRTLDLSDNPLGTRGAEAFCRAIRSNRGLPDLANLLMGNCEMGPGGAQHLGFALQYGALPRLQTLALPDNYLGSSGCTSLAFALSAGAGAGLTSLDLSANDIKATALPELCLALSSNCHLLHTLRLGFIPVGVDGGEALRVLANGLRGAKALPALTHLDLSSVDMDEQGLRHLVGALLAVGPTVTPLQSLSLSGNTRLGREELQCLLLTLKADRAKACPRLEYVELRGIRPMTAKDALILEQEMGAARRGVRVVMGA